MKVFLTLFLIIAIVSIAGLGFVMMDHNMDHGNCLAAVAGGINCSQILNPLSMAVAHAGFMAQFSNAVFAKTLSLAFVFLALFSLFALEVLRPKFTPRKFFVTDSPHAPKTRFESWFSLHENSPSFALGRV